MKPRNHRAARSGSRAAILGGIAASASLLREPWIHALPPAVARVVGMTAAPAGLRALFAQPPAPVTVELELPEVVDALPLGLRQLLKLMATSDAWRPAAPAVVGAAVGLVCVAGESRVVVGGGDRLGSAGDGADHLGAQVRRIFGGLFPADRLVATAEGFAGELARLEVLQVLTQQMLASTEIDTSLRILLTGLTSGEGLGFNRAAVLLYDEIRARFVGARAIGPATADEAHRIWETLEIEGKSLSELVAEASRQEAQGGLQVRVAGTEAIPGAGGEGDEVALAVASRRPQRFVGPPKNPGLARLGLAGPYVAAVIQPRSRPLGLVVADNLFSGQAITGEVMERLTTFLGQTSLVLDNLTLLRDVERLARYDSLTGVFNRREFEARVSVEEMRCLRAGHPCSLLVIDLDNFKAVNDSAGHTAGDELLRRTGELLLQTFRTHDLVGRFGGDEFTVLLPETGAAAMEPILRRLGTYAWEQGIAMSVGAASFPGDCEVPSGLFAIADRNLLAAKRAGRRRASLGGSGRIVRLPGDG